MRVWRTCKKARVHDLSGTGAKKGGGRWNPAGVPVLYTSENNSLCILEALAHFDKETVPDDYRLVEMEIPDSLEVKRIEPGVLPDNGREYPGPDELKEIGRKWVESCETPVLSVPSVLNPHGRNFILNPAHPGFSKVRVTASLPFTFDVRLPGKLPKTD